MSPVDIRAHLLAVAHERWVSTLVADLTRGAEYSYSPQSALSRQLRLEEFISTASHELRTPLTSLHATLELLKEETLSGGRPRGDRGLRGSRSRAGWPGPWAGSSTRPRCVGRAPGVDAAGDA
jgi:signal transduction histidine kinase